MHILVRRNILKQIVKLSLPDPFMGTATDPMHLP